MSLERLQHGALDLVLLLAQELLRRGLEEVGVLHYLHLGGRRKGRKRLKRESLISQWRKLPSIWLVLELPKEA